MRKSTPQSILCINSCIKNYYKCKPINPKEVRKVRSKKNSLCTSEIYSSLWNVQYTLEILENISKNPNCLVRDR